MASSPPKAPAAAKAMAMMAPPAAVKAPPAANKAPPAAKKAPPAAAKMPPAAKPVVMPVAAKAPKAPKAAKALGVPPPKAAKALGVPPKMVAVDLHAYTILELSHAKFSPVGARMIAARATVDNPDGTQPNFAGLSPEFKYSFQRETDIRAAGIASGIPRNQWHVLTPLQCGKLEVGRATIEVEGPPGGFAKSRYQFQWLATSVDGTMLFKSMASRSRIHGASMLVATTETMNIVMEANDRSTPGNFEVEVVLKCNMTDIVLSANYWLQYFRAERRTMRKKSSLQSRCIFSHSFLGCAVAVSS